MPVLEEIVAAQRGAFDLTRQTLVGAQDGSVQDSRDFKPVAEEAESAWNMFQYITSMDAIGDEPFRPNDALETM